ncbi:MAG: hypothetical protein JWQ27_1595 [Ferruginibacter sp.]|nr:hypothetical protein [Ferruginibacter sp.]
MIMKPVFTLIVLLFVFVQVRAQDEPFHPPEVYAANRVRGEKVYKMLGEKDSVLLTAFMYDSISGKQISRQHYRDGKPGLFSSYSYSADMRNETESLYIAGKDTAIGSSVIKRDEKGRQFSVIFTDNDGRVQMVQTTVFNNDKGYSESTDEAEGMPQGRVKTFFNAQEKPLVVEYYDSSGTLYGTAYYHYTKRGQLTALRSDFQIYKQRTEYRYNERGWLMETLEYWSTKKGDKLLMNKYPSARNNFVYYANGLLYEYFHQARNPSQQRLRRYYSFY